MMDLGWNELQELAKEYGDSFYLLDSETFESNYDEFLKAFRTIYPNTHIGYSYKTNYIPKLCSIVDRKGGYAEVVSDMEYDLAIRLGVHSDRIIVNGPYKNQHTITKCLLNGSIVNLDSFHEIDLVEKTAKEHPEKNLAVGVRCNFNIDDAYVSRFGFDVESEDLYRAFDRLRIIGNTSINGLHCHFPNRDLDSFALRTDAILQLAAALFPSPPEFIDIGGGYCGKIKCNGTYVG